MKFISFPTQAIAKGQDEIYLIARFLWYTFKMEIIKEKDVKITDLAKLLKKGKVIVCPTDTVYGLVADATNQVAVKKIFKIKQRKSEKPIPIFVKNLKIAKNFAVIEKEQEKIIKSVWPGRTTLILKPKHKLPKGIGKAGKEIGLRIPNYKIINRLLSVLDFPLTGTSANISREPASTKIQEIISQFENQKHQPDLVIDCGNLPKNKPSTVIDLTILPFKVLRE